LSGLAEEELSAALGEAGGRLQASLDLEHGPVLRAGLFDLGMGRGQRLLIAIHHLSIDGVSWRILLEDLGLAYVTLLAGEPLALRPKTTSFQAWSRHVERYARSDEALAELGYWSHERLALPIPRDFPDGRNDYSSVASVTASLSAEETESLLTGIPRVFGSQINDVLLTALAQAVRDWSGSGSVLVDLEGHGREDLFTGVDLSRTVGWFTSIFPVELRLDDLTDPAGAIRAVKNLLRSVPNKGIGYGILRYLGGTRTTEVLRHLPAPEINFNYLGRFSQEIAGLGRYAEAGEPRDHVASPDATRPWLLEIEGIVRGPIFSVEIMYSKNVHERDTVAALADRFLAQIRVLMKFSQKFEMDDGLAVTDISLSNLTTRDMENILKGLGR
jgi:non-ribosomal peptide synthase protein (TIGR01720 family)